MYIDLTLLSQLQPYVSFDWRFVAERGLRCYGHVHHASRNGLTTVAACEVDFLIKMSNEEHQQHFFTGSGHSLEPNMINSATKSAIQFKCVGAIRKAGFLSVKKWIFKRRQTIELARKQGWKRYWVCLRGTALLFHSVIDKKNSISNHAKISENYTQLSSWCRNNCVKQPHEPFENLGSENRKDFSNLSDAAHCYIEKEPRHLIIIDDAIAQPIPEHPKRDFVFCLSTTFGDAYLFQASCQLESDNWCSALHNACAASIARDLTRDETIKLFQMKLRHLELGAEKKLFLRQRLESRLISMSSMSHISAIVTSVSNIDQQSNDPKDIYSSQDEDDMSKMTMRSLLCRLNMQLVALDTYIEQIHCEIFQLKCYLSSCLSQKLHYKESWFTLIDGCPIPSPLAPETELPHPKSLLIHVCKQTKAILLKLGVFTVSSFHAYVHARQGSAENILKTIQQASQQANTNRCPFELRVISQSISEKLLTKTKSLNQLEVKTEKLIDLTNLKTIAIKLNRKLFNSISRDGIQFNPESDDRYSILEDDEMITINLKLHMNSNTTTIIKQVLLIIDPSSYELDFLNYYLLINTKNYRETANDTTNYYASGHFIAKRLESLSDWSNLEYIEVLEKIVFRIQLNRNKMNNDPIPFGMSIGAQLFVCKFESLLNVYCNYIKCSSEADKAGLKDEDELLMINGIPVKDLDMMFIECMVHDETKLKLIVRSSKQTEPKSAIRLDRSTWKSLDDDEDNENGQGNVDDALDQKAFSLKHIAASGSQIISDEYISSLVCPPPPSNSNAFLRSDAVLLRQKSDSTLQRKLWNLQLYDLNQNLNRKLNIRTGLAPSATNPSFLDSHSDSMRIRGQQNLDSSLVDDGSNDIMSYEAEDDSLNRYPLTGMNRDAVDLASQLKKKTEQLTRLLGKNSWDGSNLDYTKRKDESQNEISIRSNHMERLKKSVLELLETEFAYLKHLEATIEHYMNPLEENQLLNAASLKELNQIMGVISNFQIIFYEKLISRITNELPKSYQCDTNPRTDDTYEVHSKVIQQIDSLKTPCDFEPILKAITTTFREESEKFKIYSGYCVAYSKLQRFLHPRLAQVISKPSVSIISAPDALDSFLTSNNTAVGIIQHRELFKPFGSFISKDAAASSQLKQLSEFLSNLDSSSSSASLSLPKSFSSEVFNGVNEKSTRFDSSFQRSQQQNFESYLIKPIQRIVKYPMLLDSISSCANPCDVSIRTDLQEVVKLMSAIASHINDAQRIYDEYGQVFGLIERQFHNQLKSYSRSNSLVSSIIYIPPIDLSMQRLLHFDYVDWLNINEFTSKVKKVSSLSQMIFVFDSCVVFICTERLESTKKKTSTTNLVHSSVKSTSFSHKLSPDVIEIIKYQSLIPVKEVQVRSVPRTNDETQEKNQYIWELFRCSSANLVSNLMTKLNKRSSGGKMYLLSSKTCESRNAFLRKIRFIIRESVRNMSLPPAKSSFALKSSSPKKLSSPSSVTNSNSSCSQSNSLNSIRQARERCETDDNRDDGFINQVNGNLKTSIQVNN